jgi:hypothetical protein
VTYKSLSVVVLGVTGLLTWGAIELMPETLFFPVVEYSVPGDIHFTMLKAGELDRTSCDQAARQLSASVKTHCPQCNYVERCFRGLSSDRRQILSRDALATPSVRTPGSGITMTISAADPELALNVCRLIEQQSASQPLDKRARCYPAFAGR